MFCFPRINLLVCFGLSFFPKRPKEVFLLRGSWCRSCTHWSILVPCSICRISKKASFEPPFPFEMLNISITLSWAGVLKPCLARPATQNGPRTLRDQIVTDSGQMFDRCWFDLSWIFEPIWTHRSHKTKPTTHDTPPTTHNKASKPTKKQAPRSTASQTDRPEAPQTHNCLIIIFTRAKNGYTIQTSS